MRSYFPVLVVVFLLSVPVAARAQDVPAEGAPDPVASALDDIRDADRPLGVRAQIVSRLLAEKDPRALEGLAAMLSDPKTPDDLRMTLVTGILTARGLPLLDQVLDLVIAAKGMPLEKRIHSWFLAAATSDLAKGLEARIGDPQLSIERRLVAIGLLGETRRKEAVPALIDLWEKSGKPVNVAARDALYVWIPRRFDTPAAAREFWEGVKDEPRELILEKLLREELDGKKRDPAVDALIADHRAALPYLPLDLIIERYLPNELADVRVMGAERLGTYPYDDREGEGAAAARRGAADALLVRLDSEEDDAVLVPILGSLRKLAEPLRAMEGDRAFIAIQARLDSGSEAVRKAAVLALGDLGDRKAVPPLQRVYEEASSTDLKLAALDALGVIGNGITQWILAELDRDGLDETLVLRLIRLLRGHADLTGAAPVLTKLLATSKQARVRAEAASTLGIIGENEQNSDVFLALAKHGLSDADESVRDISAAQLRAAKAPPDAMVAALRERLGDKEKSARVRSTAARTLLVLRGLAEIPAMAAYLADDEFWKKAPRQWLTVDVIANGKRAEAVQLVRWLFDKQMHERCAEAARLVLAAKELTWGEGAGPSRAEVVSDLVTSLERAGKPEQALAALRENLPALEGDGGAPDGLRLAEGRLLIATGAPAEAVKMLDAVVKKEAAPEAIRMAARIQLARAQLALGRPAAAAATVEPLLAHPEMGPKATEVADTARLLLTLLADLDGTDPAKRTAAIAALKDHGASAYPTLLVWLNARPADKLAQAVEAIAGITGATLTYDPAAPEAKRQAALEAARKALGS